MLGGTILDIFLFHRLGSVFPLYCIFPGFCIASAILMDSIRIKLKNAGKNVLSKIMVLSIFAFGFVVTTMLITLNVNSANYSIHASIAEHLPSDNNVTMIGSHWWDWNTYWSTNLVITRNTT